MRYDSAIGKAFGRPSARWFADIFGGWYGVEWSGLSAAAAGAAMGDQIKGLSR